MGFLQQEALLPVTLFRHLVLRAGVLDLLFPRTLCSLLVISQELQRCGKCLTVECSISCLKTSCRLFRQVHLAYPIGIRVLRLVCNLERLMQRRMAPQAQLKAEDAWWCRAVSGIIKQWEEPDAPCNSERYGQQGKILARHCPGFDGCFN